MDIDVGNEWIEANRRKQKQKNSKKVVIDNKRIDEHFKCHSCGKDFKTQTELDDHTKTHSKEKSISCGKCEKLFGLQSELSAHEKLHTRMKPYNCQKCGIYFELENDLRDHVKTHIQEESFTCGKCNISFNSKESFKEHEKSHGTAETEFKCQKCEKVYSSMVKLRRHDWRSHRLVSCNICDEEIESRADISNHRQTKHQIFRKVMCRFFPACLDEDECFFSHGRSIQRKVDEEKSRPVCSMGQNCTNQSC
jgi:transcription elongation factor Elf1